MLRGRKHTKGGHVSQKKGMESEIEPLVVDL